MRDLYAPAAPGSLMRAYPLDETGIFRFSRRDAELYSVQIKCAGIWGRLKITDGRGEKLFSMPSMFTGSFWLSVGARDGIIVEMDCRTAGAPPSIMLNWRERDATMQ